MSDVQESQRTRIIRALNDHCRITFTGCRVMLTARVAELDPEPKAKLLEAIRTFNAFDNGNDPHHEHDFGAIDLDGERWFFKWDYYSPDMRTGSDDPSNVEKTRRVLTIMHSSDY